MFPMCSCSRIQGAIWKALLNSDTEIPCISAIELAVRTGLLDETEMRKESSTGEDE